MQRLFALAIRSVSEKMAEAVEMPGFYVDTAGDCLVHAGISAPPNAHTSHIWRAEIHTIFQIRALGRKEL
jgi:hypothetical protein